MASQIDETVPADNTKVDKSQLRANFLAAKNEINAISRNARVPWQVAIGAAKLTE